METVVTEEEVYTYCKDVPTYHFRWKEIITYIMIIYSLLNINVWQWESIKNRQKKHAKSTTTDIVFDILQKKFLFIIQTKAIFHC